MRGAEAERNRLAGLREGDFVDLSVSEIEGDLVGHILLSNSPGLGSNGHTTSTPFSSEVVRAAAAALGVERYLVIGKPPPGIDAAAVSRESIVQLSGSVSSSVAALSLEDVFMAAQADGHETRDLIIVDDASQAGQWVAFIDNIASSYRPEVRKRRAYLFVAAPAAADPTSIHRLLCCTALNGDLHPSLSRTHLSVDLMGHLPRDVPMALSDSNIGSRLLVAEFALDFAPTPPRPVQTAAFALVPNGSSFAIHPTSVSRDIVVATYSKKTLMDLITEMKAVPR